MAETVLTNAKVTINAVDLSDHVKSVTINYAAELHDDTAMGDTSHSRLAGLKDWSMNIEFHQDEAAGEVAATLFPLVGAAAFAVSVLPVNTTISATNPNYNGNAVLEGFPPVAGNVGDLHVASITLQGAGTLSRSTSA